MIPTRRVVVSATTTTTTTTTTATIAEKKKKERKWMQPGTRVANKPKPNREHKRLLHTQHRKHKGLEDGHKSNGNRNKKSQSN